MNQLYFNRICHLLTLISFISLYLVESKIIFKDGGYESITIEINERVTEDLKIVENLKDILKEASKTFWSVSGYRAFFREFNIIVPFHWNVKPDKLISSSCQDKSDIIVNLPGGIDEPYTEHKGGCGNEGEFIFLPTNFITDSQKNKDKTFIHEWAHFRYGVFDEHGIKGDALYPPITVSHSGNVIYTSCVKVDEADGEIISETDDCELVSGSQTIDPSCTFTPNDDVEMKASLMFKPIQDSMKGFCIDKTDDDEYIHYDEAQTPHNDICYKQSVSSVILSHDDFKNQATRPDPKSISETKINILKISDVDSDEVFVLTYDVSGSMSLNNKIIILSKSSQDFIKTSLPDGTKLGLVQFATVSTALHEIVQVDSNTRKTLLAKVPVTANGNTAIGKGIEEALNMIDRYGSYSQATIILISDGEETTSIYPNIDEVIPKFSNYPKVRVTTYAFGTLASENMRKLADETNGDRHSTALTNSPEIESQTVANVLLDIVSSTCDPKMQKIRIASEYITMTTMRTTRTIVVDPGLGKSTIFLINSDDIDKLKVTFKSPNGKLFDENSDEVDISDKKTVKLEISFSDPGKWSLFFEKKIEFKSESISLSMDVFSQYITNSSDYPIILESSISHPEVDSNNPPKVFGYLKKGYNPILMASVSARVEQPSGPNVEIKLEDNGIGADSVKNDGIYSAYFTNFTVKGRYNVLVSASSNGNAKLKFVSNSKNLKSLNKNKRIISSKTKTLSISDFKQVLFFSNTNVNSTPVPQFSRVQNSGAFNLKNLSNYDTTPPIRVIDLSLASIDENSRTIDLTWTSAGDDLTSGTAKQIQIRADSDLSKLQNDAIFDSLFLFTSQEVIQGSLNPLVGGVKHLIKLSVDRFSNGNKFSVHFALKTIDENNNVSPKSNIITAHFGIFKKLIVLHDSYNTLGKDMLSKRFNISIQNLLMNGTFIVDIPVKDIQNLKINFRSPDGVLIDEKCACFLRNEIHGQIIMIQEGNLFGTWTLYMQRLIVDSFREDINFSINLQKLE